MWLCFCIFFFFSILNCPLMKTNLHLRDTCINWLFCLVRFWQCLLGSIELKQLFLHVYFDLEQVFCHSNQISIKIHYHVSNPLICKKSNLYAKKKQHSYFFHKCISEKELESNREPVCVLFTFLTPLLPNRKLLSWIFGIDRGLAFEWLVGVCMTLLRTQFQKLVTFAFLPVVWCGYSPRGPPVCWLNLQGWWNCLQCPGTTTPGPAVRDTVIVHLVSSWYVQYIHTVKSKCMN